MFGTIRKHQTWLWGVIITLTIISFVYFFSPYQKMDRGGGPVNFGSINGQRISREEFIQARADALLNYFFRHGGSWPEDNKTQGWDTERETYFRLLLLQKQADLGIHVSDTVVAQAAREMLRSFQKPNASAADVFRDQVLAKVGLTLSDFERFVRHEVGMQELINAVAMGGRLVTPEEAKGLYIREHEERATQAVFFSPSNYLASVTVTPEALGTFFTNQQAIYRIPERIQLNYVKFEYTNFLAEATNLLSKLTNLDLQIEQAYRENPTNLLQEAKAISLEDAKVKIRERQLVAFETQLARKKASEFAYQLDEKEALGPQALAAVAQTNGMTVQVSAPFDQIDGPKDIQIGPGFAKAAFGLTNSVFAGPLVGDDAAYIITLNNRIPSEAPAFDQIKERVEADYKLNLATTMTRQAGIDFTQNATNQIAQGKSFPDVCVAAKVTLVEIPPFSLSTQSLPGSDVSTLNQLKQAAFGADPGKIAGYYSTDDGGGFVLYIRSILPIDQIKLERELPAFINYVRTSRENEAFQIWFRREVDRGLHDTPMLRREKQGPGGTTTARS